MKINTTVAVQLELRHGLHELVRKFPRLTTHEAQARARTWLDGLGEGCDDEAAADHDTCASRVDD